MVLLTIAIVWIILSILVGFVGIKKRIGFYDPFFTSLLLSPLLGILMIYKEFR